MDDYPSFVKDGQNTIVVGKGGEVKILASQEDSITNHATRVGGSRPTTKQVTSKSKKPKTYPTVPVTAVATYTEEVIKPQPKEKVFFSNDFGSIRMIVESVLYNNEAAIGLIFDSVDDVLFEPKKGETLQLTTIKGKYTVMYPGTLFELPYDQKQLMVLYIVPEDIG